MNNYTWKNHLLAGLHLQHVSFAFDSIICKIVNLDVTFFKKFKFINSYSVKYFNKILHSVSQFDNARSLEHDEIAKLNIFETKMPCLILQIDFLL